MSRLLCVGVLGASNAPLFLKTFVSASETEAAGGPDAFLRVMHCALDVVEAELAATASAGPYFAGAELTLVDITFVPFLERMAASLAYYKGFEMEGGGALGARPNLDAWFRAMENRADTYAGIKSDYYTHAHDLPPQLGGRSCAWV